LTNDERSYTYDGRSNVINVHGKYFSGGVWHECDVASAFDAKNRRVMKSFRNATTGAEAQWFFYYDALDRLAEVRHTPNIASPSTYTLFQFFWLGNRAVAFWQTDLPTGTTSKRYVATDESGRPVDMWSWPATGNAARVWAINASAWGTDTNLIGATVYQPILFAGQYYDLETAALANSGSSTHRMGTALNGHRTFDPTVGAYLQLDPMVDSTWSPYVYVESNPVGLSDPTGLTTCTRPSGTEIYECDGNEQIEIVDDKPDDVGPDSGLGDFFGQPIRIVPVTPSPPTLPQPPPLSCGPACQIEKWIMLILTPPQGQGPGPCVDRCRQAYQSLVKYCKSPEVHPLLKPGCINVAGVQYYACVQKCLTEPILDPKSAITARPRPQQFLDTGDTDSFLPGSQLGGRP
jgi:RHS repeat-associated protein